MEINKIKKDKNDAFQRLVWDMEFKIKKSNENIREYFLDCGSVFNLKTE